METLSSVSPTIVLPPNNPHRPFQKHNNLIISNSLTKTKTRQFPIFRQERCIRRWPAADNTSCGFSGRSSSGDIEGEESNKEELERALHLDGSIPGSSDEFVKRVSSRAYDMRRNVQQSLDTTSYDVLEANPWRESSKPVYVLTQKENQICTMKTRRSRSEVERELGQLFSKGGKRRPEFGNKTKQSRSGTEFRMLVEDVREGVLTGRNLHQEVTEKFPVMNIKVPVDVFKGISDEEAAKIISLDPKVAYSDGSMKQGKKLDKLVCACDCTVLEFNLLAAETSNDQLVAAIANDNVVFGQKEIFPLRDSSQRKPREFAAAKAYGIYIGLDGGIGFMVNGAGLAMATVDIIKLRAETHMVMEAAKRIH